MRSDLAAAEQALLRWARIVRPSVTSLGALSAALREGPQRDAIAALQRARYADGDAPGPRLRDAFAKGFDWLPPTQGGSDDALPPLYPR